MPPGYVTGILAEENAEQVFLLPDLLFQSRHFSACGKNQLLGLAHVYLGYWIDRSGKMAYKAQFGPHELLVGGDWQRADAAPDTSKGWET